MELIVSFPRTPKYTGGVRRIVLSYAPSAAAVWHSVLVWLSNIGHTKIYYIFAEETPAIFLYEIIFGIRMGGIREARLPSWFPKNIPNT